MDALLQTSPLSLYFSLSTATGILIPNGSQPCHPDFSTGCQSWDGCELLCQDHVVLIILTEFCRTSHSASKYVMFIIQRMELFFFFLWYLLRTSNPCCIILRHIITPSTNTDSIRHLEPPSLVALTLCLYYDCDFT